MMMMMMVRREVIVEGIWPVGIPIWSCVAAASNEQKGRAGDNRRINRMWLVVVSEGEVSAYAMAKRKC